VHPQLHGQTGTSSFGGIRTSKPIYEKHIHIFTFEKKYMDKKSKMFQLVEGWKNSGLSKVAFSRQHGITIRSFEYWCRKLKKEGDKPPINNQSGIKHISPPSFIEIGNNSAHSSDNRQAQVELELPGGLRIKIY
jgi:hypothetical protein